MDVQELIAKWYSIATEGSVGIRDVFFNFVAVWVAFNALYTSRHSDDTGDWDQIRSFAGEPEAIDRHRILLLQEPEYQQAVGVLKQDGVYDTHRRRRRTIRDENNLTEVATCLYQVRCNLFHGGKMPGNPRDERLVEASYKVVSRLIEPYVPT